MANSTVLFDLPQQELASLLTSQMEQASAIRIVSGFATPGGLATIAGPFRRNPQKLHTIVIGAATYSGFEALDELLAMGVSADRLHVHLGHTGSTGFRKNPYARFHPMLHSKVYYIEFTDGRACAFIGSHNVTTYALSGLNGEASVLLKGEADDPEFIKVRSHIDEAQRQAISYMPDMKEAYAWWTREFIDGLKAEVGIPSDWITVRTILLFAEAPNGERPSTGDHLYFELPAGIEQIESLKTETHLFLFDSLPTDPRDALNRASQADACYICDTLGVENQQGNKELQAEWRIDNTAGSTLKNVPGAIYRPITASGVQQVRAQIKAPSIPEFEYLFDRENKKWVPKFDQEEKLAMKTEHLEQVSVLESTNARRVSSWQLVRGLEKASDAARERDQMALALAAPESGSFTLVSLRRRKRSDQ